MLAEPSRTDFDLSWRMFGIPVRVHPMFWLVAIVLGWNFAYALGLKYLLVWVACMFVSILVHELGHVFMGMAFGARSHIVFWGFGGLAVGSLNVRHTWQRVAVLLAGPGAGLLLYVLVRVVIVAAGPSLDDILLDRPNLVWAAIEFLTWVNLVWSLVNLLPIWPLDGGQVCGELLVAAMGRDGFKAALTVSIVLAGLLALWVFFPDRIPPDVPALRGIRNNFNGIMCLLIAAENVQVLMQLNDRRGGDWE